MNVDNTDIDMQHPEFQPEDVQTSHEVDLFNDDEDNDKDAGDSMDAVSQHPTSVLRVEKRARDEVISGKCCFREVDYLETLRQTVYEQQEHINNIMEETEVIRREAQDHIEEQCRLAEEERERHMRDFNEKTRQWEAALKEQEREKQDIHTWQEQQQALLRKNVSEELARHEAKISARKDQELTEELAQHNTDLNARKNLELEEHKKAIFAEME
ncbi:hypothetical protein F4604DRAFT_1930673 [Suillus subluteus]|nr:hypothetical protein F4604DRAFT_1930673 [Suillus subluteus]